MLLHADQDRALSYLASCLDQVTSFGDILQLVIVELIYKVNDSPLFVLSLYPKSNFVQLIHTCAFGDIIGISQRVNVPNVSGLPC